VRLGDNTLEYREHKMQRDFGYLTIHLKLGELKEEGKGSSVKSEEGGLQQCDSLHIRISHIVPFDNAHWRKVKQLQQCDRNTN